MATKVFGEGNSAEKTIAYNNQDVDSIPLPQSDKKTNQCFCNSLSQCCCFSTPKARRITTRVCLIFPGCSGIGATVYLCAIGNYFWGGFSLVTTLCYSACGIECTEDTVKKESSKKQAISKETSTDLGERLI